MKKLYVIIGSVRPGRIGASIGEWVYEQLENGGYNVELIDLAEESLPMLNEPVPAKQGIYTHNHTKKWSSKMADGDAFLIVTPEYNNGYPASLKNALDYLYAEWTDKPVGFVGYGWKGATGAIGQLEQVVRELQMRPQGGVNVAFAPGIFDRNHQLRDANGWLGDYATEVNDLGGRLLKSA